MPRGNNRHKFWKKAKVSDECWPWQEGLSDPGGYGKTTQNDKTEYAHRIAWELFHNEKIPEGMCVLHTCDNPPCINPFHLYLGTKAENNTDRAKKGRNGNLEGEDHPNAKFSDDTIRKMRELYLTGNYTHSMIGEIFGTSTAYVTKVIKRQRRTNI